MLIKVTQDDIDRGVHRSCDKCPVTLAVNRVLLDYYRTWSTRYKIFICAIKENLSVKRVSFNTPFPVAEFICQFDRRNSVEPFEFEIPIPEHYLAR